MGGKSKTSKLEEIKINQMNTNVLLISNITTMVGKKKTNKILSSEFFATYALWKGTDRT